MWPQIHEIESVAPIINAKSFDFEKLPIDLQLLILNSVRMTEALLCLKVNKFFRREILRKGPFPKKIPIVRYGIFDYEKLEDRIACASIQVEYSGENESAFFTKRAMPGPRSTQLAISQGYAGLFSKSFACCKMISFSNSSLSFVRPRDRNRYNLGEFLPKALVCKEIRLIDGIDLRIFDHILYDNEKVDFSFFRNIPRLLRAIEDRFSHCRGFMFKEFAVPEVWTALSKTNSEMLKCSFMDLNLFEESMLTIIRLGIPSLRSDARVKFSFISDAREFSADPAFQQILVHFLNVPGEIEELDMEMPSNQAIAKQFADSVLKFEKSGPTRELFGWWRVKKQAEAILKSRSFKKRWTPQLETIYHLAQLDQRFYFYANNRISV